MATLVKGIILIVVISSIECASLHHAKSREPNHRQSKATNMYTEEDLPPNLPLQAEPLKRASFEANIGNEPTGESVGGDGGGDLAKSNVFFGDQNMGKTIQNSAAPMAPTFENVAPNYIGPNYMMNGNGNNNLVNRNSLQEESPERHAPSMAFPGAASLQANLQSNPYLQSLFGGGPQTLGQTNKPPKEDSINDVFMNTFKRYNVKKYLLSKIFGNSHELDEDESGFFSNKHLKRHGTAGVAAKVIGELIGIKIRESIEGLGKSVSEYAKDLTARNFVSLGNVFTKFLRIQ